jgi:hypothetical protein
MIGSNLNGGGFVNVSCERSRPMLSYIYIYIYIYIHLVCPSVYDTTFYCKIIFYVSAVEPAMGKSIIVWNA